MQTLFIGQHFIELDSVDSTNNYAAKLIQDTKVAEGTVIMSHFQTSGKGQRGNIWQSNPGQNLLFSIVLHPKFLNPGNYFSLSKAIALGIMEALESFISDQIFIKWPNDILVNQKKIGGILIENVYRGQELSHAIVGIGLNVNQTHFESSAITSLSLLKQKNLDGKEVLNVILKKIEENYLKLKKGCLGEIDSGYLNNLLYYEQKKPYLIRNEKIHLTIKSVSSNGQLITLNNLGEEQIFNFKELEFIL